MKKSLAGVLAMTALTLCLPDAGRGADAASVGEPVRCLVKPLDRTEIASEVAGRVVRVPHRSGEGFNKGDVLVQFDCTLLKAELTRAQARQSAAAIKVKHNNKLQEFKSVGVLDVELDKAALDVTASETRIASLAVDRCSVIAPFDGRVVQVLVNEHQTVKPQQPLLEILSPKRLELEVMAPSDWLPWLKPGHPFRIKVDETGGEYAAKVVAIGAAVDPVSKMVLVRGKLDNPPADLVPGMGASAVFAPPPQ